MRSASVVPSTSSITRARTPSGSLEPVDRGDVRMVQRRERLRLAFETRQALGIGREESGSTLMRDLAVEPGIARTIHLAHPARAEGRDDVVGAESGNQG